MNYHCFLRTITSYQTDKIRFISFPNSCATNRIPSAFRLLVSDIIRILDKNNHYLCKPEQSLVIFGIQPGPPLLESEDPLLLDRVICDEHPSYHLCFILQYLVVAKEQLSKITSWHGAKNLLIDFTTGRIMDSEGYFSLLSKKEFKGIDFGTVDQKKLALAWNRLNNDHQKSHFLSNAA